jgi:hypothetical protein
MGEYINKRLLGRMCKLIYIASYEPTRRGTALHLNGQPTIAHQTLIDHVCSLIS